MLGDDFLERSEARGKRRRRDSTACSIATRFRRGFRICLGSIRTLAMLNNSARVPPREGIRRAGGIRRKTVNAAEGFFWPGIPIAP